MAECLIGTAAARWGGRFVALGALVMALAVIFGAAGDHLVAGRVSAEDLHIYDIANRFQIYHGLGLLFIGVLIRQYGKRRLLYAAGGLMALGTLLFCGGLYLLTLTGDVSWAFFAPVGGITLILSWLLLALSMWRASAT
ncbi:conserved membrane protein of unknown function [Acidithiobacillus ferrivorans]|jgi:uncharacterized membrane protein YgdD (TMEM256/DUF423 family)|uniref:DUF423 domain-containing protein n=1 Tax=Acidithiobacillus ferrivorans TaxID=160808 RepID=A0A060UR28_9PROT|nr:DUF423 domain-containing protein [Acidithiobacillus ferrivorans]MBN6739213.1 DUF423 domain-containing protein [Acidithiobacillus sp. MC6.1]MBU2765262.1 DUF423 domain-containing protein [Acidithiobacillus ferrivorans]MBU2851583.1 DUF423 domain-containing protein [Acidithiobacillus ferrivorans]OCB01981.1 hypothetical protein BBC27_01085 [Acidithiobacillus ferrivorans]QQD73934.1 DUF423 domain-containing protein [Acidithiobacillus ferrivorans]